MTRNPDYLDLGIAFDWSKQIFLAAQETEALPRSE